MMSVFKPQNVCAGCILALNPELSTTFVLEASNLMRLSGLFWNLAGADRVELVAEAATERELDVVILAEPGTGIDRCRAALHGRTGVQFHCPPSFATRLQVYGRSSNLDLSELYVDDNKRLSIRRLMWRGREFLLVAAHLISKLHWHEQSQNAEAQVVAGEIQKEEAKHGHQRTIVVGDLNMNPFEPGVVQANCLHAMMCKADVAGRTRTVQARRYPFFYNPMWGMFGDRTPGPPGSYYQRRAEHLCYDWNLFDQLLLRPDVLQYAEESVELVSRIGDKSLLNRRGRPDRSVGSDHLPLFFCLKPKSEAST